MANFQMRFFLTLLFSLFLVGASPIPNETCQQSLRDITTVMTLEFYQFQVEQMMLAYNSKDPMTGVSIIENGIEWFDALKKQENEVFDKNSLSKDIAIFYVRLGNLHLKAGKQNLYESFLLKAINLYNSTCDDLTCRKIDREKMISLVNEMDKSRSH